MKKISCILLSVVIFVTTSFSFCLPCFADASAAVFKFTKDVVLDYAKKSISSISDSLSKKTEAARSGYFSHIVDSAYSNGITIFDESGTRFTDEIIDFHFNQYWDSVISDQGVYFSDLDVFLSAAGFSYISFDIRLLKFTQFYAGNLFTSIGLNSISNSKSTVKAAFKNYYDSYLARFIFAQGGSATDPNPGKTGLEIAPGYTTGADLKEAVTTDNTKYYPKNATGKMTYRTDKQNQLSPHFIYQYGPTFYENGFTAVGGGDDIYLVGFYFDGEKYYYSENQYHLYFESEEVWMEDRDEIDYVKKILYEDVWSNIDGSPDNILDENKHIKLLDFIDFPYIYIHLHPAGGDAMYFRYFKNYTDYVTCNNYSQYAWSSGYYKSFDTTYTTEISTFNSYHHFTSTHDTDCNCNADVGYIASLSPIKMVYDVDTSKIPDDAVITVGGDNIYNYYITNPDTGESSTMNEYITNNYTYITNNNGGEGSGSGGSVGGNVTVGGEIAVGGEVGVDITVSVPDININVNNNGAGGTGVTPNPDDFLGDSEVDLTSYYDKAVEDASGVRQFLGTFFDFLPAELLGLLCLLVAVAICCRIFGR